MSIAVFAYGTLQIPEVMALVAGREFPAVAATLEGFARYRIKGKSYPGVRPQRDASVPGLLYLDMDTDAVRKLDDFEDHFYRRQTLNVIPCRGAAVAAEVYVIAQRHYGLLEDALWDLEEFRRQSLAEFMTRCKDGRPHQPR